MKSLTFQRLFLLFIIMVIGKANLPAQDLPDDLSVPTGEINGSLPLSAKTPNGASLVILIPGSGLTDQYGNPMNRKNSALIPPTVVMKSSDIAVVKYDMAIGYPFTTREDSLSILVQQKPLPLSSSN